MEAAPFTAMRYIDECAAFGVSASRIMTPAFARVCVLDGRHSGDDLDVAGHLAVGVVELVGGAPMSAPAPVTVKVPALWSDEPAISGSPMSVDVHPLGRLAVATACSGVTETLFMAAMVARSSLRLVTSQPHIHGLATSR